MRKLDKEYLNSRAAGLVKAGFPVSRWIEFSLAMLNSGYKISLIAAKTTKSKYIHVYKFGKCFKVRFSDHKPSHKAEIIDKNCDFFVGVTRTGVRTTQDAIKAVNDFFTGAITAHDETFPY